MNEEFKNGFEKVAKMSRQEMIGYIHEGNLDALKDYGTPKDFARFGGGGAALGLGLGSGAALGASVANKYIGSGAGIGKSLRKLAPSVGKAGLIAGALGLAIAGGRRVGKAKISTGKHFKDISDKNLAVGVKQIDQYYKRKNK